MPLQHRIAHLAGSVALLGLLTGNIGVAQQKVSNVRHWVGTAQINGQAVPVSLDLEAPGAGGAVSGSFVNGPERAASSSGSESKGHLQLNFDYYARRLEGAITPTGFQGTFSGARIPSIPVKLAPDREGKPATRFVAAEHTGNRAFNAIGDWEVSVHSSKGESAWTLRISEYGGNGELKAVFLRVDGDSGGLYGGFDAAKQEYRVSRFGASGAQFYALKPQGDGTLQVTNLFHTEEQWTARRQAVARAENLAPPTKATEQTTVVDPREPLRYAGVNLAGEQVTQADPLFRGKVVIVAIGGSWCPNCHDEAPFLVDLYNRYHARGLEIVNLSFEEEDQLKDPQRLRAFVTRYRIPYTVLVAGTTDQLNEKLPQGKNLNCWPTSFFVGRDGLVKETHAGFSGPATGQSYVDLKTETNTLVEKLLAQRDVAER